MHATWAQPLWLWTLRTAIAIVAWTALTVVTAASPAAIATAFASTTSAAIATAFASTTSAAIATSIASAVTALTVATPTTSATIASAVTALAVTTPTPTTTVASTASATISAFASTALSYKLCGDSAFVFTSAEDLEGFLLTALGLGR